MQFFSYHSYFHQKIEVIWCRQPSKFVQCHEDNAWYIDSLILKLSSQIKTEKMLSVLHKTLANTQTNGKKINNRKMIGKQKIRQPRTGPASFRTVLGVREASSSPDARTGPKKTHDLVHEKNWRPLFVYLRFCQIVLSTDRNSHVGSMTYAIWNGSEWDWKTTFVRRYKETPVKICAAKNATSTRRECITAIFFKYLSHQVYESVS